MFGRYIYIERLTPLPPAPSFFSWGAAGRSGNLRDILRLSWISSMDYLFVVRNLGGILGGILMYLGGSWGISWGILGASFRCLRGVLGHLGGILGRLEGIWGHLGASWEPLGDPLDIWNHFGGITWPEEPVLELISDHRRSRCYWRFAVLHQEPFTCTGLAGTTANQRK